MRMMKKKKKKRKRPAEKEKERLNECRLHGGVMNDTSLGSHSSICPSSLLLPPSSSSLLLSQLISLSPPTSVSPFFIIPSLPPFLTFFLHLLIHCFLLSLSRFNLLPSFLPSSPRSLVYFFFLPLFVRPSSSTYHLPVFLSSTSPLHFLFFLPHLASHSSSTSWLLSCPL